jgi:hypothetical protein
MGAAELEARIQSILKKDRKPRQRDGMSALEARIQARLAAQEQEGPPVELAGPEPLTQEEFELGAEDLLQPVSSPEKLKFIRNAQASNQRFLREDVDPTESINLGSRLKAQVSPNKTGVVNSLINDFGQDNVRVVADPETQEITGIFAREAPGEKFKPLDKEGFIGDIIGDTVDILPDIGESLVGIGGTIGGTVLGSAASPAGAVAGGIAGGAAADALSAVGRVKLAEAIGADPEMTSGDIAKLAGFNVATGLLGEGVQGIFRGARAALKPSVRLEREIAKQTGGKSAFREAAQEGLELSRRTGVDLNLAQATGSSAASRVQGELAGSAGDFPLAQAAEKSLKQFQNFTEKTIKSLAKGGGKVTRTEAGERAAKAIGRNIDTLVKERSSRFGEALNIAEAQSGGKSIIQLENFEKVLNDEIDLIKSTPGARVNKAPELRYLNRLKEDLGNFRPEEGALASISPLQMNNQLRDLVDASDFLKKPKTLETRGDVGVSRIAKRLLGAAQDDLSQAVESGVAGAGALRQARNEFAQMSQDIAQRKSKLAKTAIKAVGIDDVSRPEEVVKKFASAEPEEFARTIAVLDEIDAGAARDIRRAAVDEIFEGSKKVSDAGDVFITPDGIERLFNNKKSRRFIMGIAEDNKQAMAMINDLRSVAKKLQTKSAGGTAGGAGFFGLAQKGARLAKGDITAAIPSTRFLLRKERFLKMMADPKQWSEFMKIADPPKSWTRSAATAAKEVGKAISRIEALQARQDVLESGLFGEFTSDNVETASEGQ